MKLYTIAFRNISRNRRRSLLSATAIAVASMAIVMLFSLLAGVKEDMAYNIQTFYTGQVRIRHRDYDRFEQLNPLHLRIEDPARIMGILEHTEGVAAVSPRISYPAAVYQDEETHGALVLGVDLVLEEKYQNLSGSLIAGIMPREGENEALVGKRLADDLGLKVGDKVTLLATTVRRGSNAITVRVTGIAGYPVDALNKLVILMSADRARRLARMDDAATEIIMKIEPRADADVVAAAINRALLASGREEIEAKSWLMIPSSYSFIQMADTVYGFVALFFFILASSVIVNTTMMVIFERMREIGTIGAMGMTGGQIVGLFFLEALFLGVLGALAGVVLGVGFTIPLEIYGVNFGAAMEGVDWEMGSTIFARLTFRSTVIVFFYAVTVAALASLIPAARAARIKPAEALRST